MPRDLPIIVIAEDTREKIEGIMSRIDDVMGDGIIALETAAVLQYALKLHHA